ncbi:hypothetical protein ACIOC2_30025 [Streptomyces sp. NPDC088337]|uniref:hypothetical protein n=1 Tax=unclassified Streptomyces TaxID=2593676 RepID=UPI002DDC2FFA|nr:hypothetical protein [Streptomyces sp. NBC_01788]WSB26048.1 hypothetical protein OIE49_09210 [Streptomyces sp. NBC_01788]
MRLLRGAAPLIVAVALALSLPYGSTPDTRARAGPPAAPEPFGAGCRTTVSGSEVTAYCHNPYPGTDSVSLHVECDHWWDIGSDGSPVAAEPAQTVRMTGRCWKEVRSAWVTHQRAG